MTGIGVGNVTVNITLSSASRSIQSIVYPAGAGTVTGGGVFTTGQPVTLTAVPNQGYRFVSWRENRSGIGSTNPLVFNAMSDRVLEAVFVADLCSPQRPPVIVSTGPASGGLAATVSSSAGILSIRFISTDNTLVDVNGQTNMSGSWTVNYPAYTMSTGFVFRRQVQSGSGTVRFEVTDGCGTWMSFVGGGDSAW